jgi:hypothetical protein
MVWLILIFFTLLWITSGVIYYRSKRYNTLWSNLLIPRFFIAVWEIWLEFAYLRVEDGKTTYRVSWRKYLSHISHAAFHSAWIIKVLYPLWATVGNIEIWQTVAASISTPLILGLASHSIASATAYHFGKKQEIDQQTLEVAPEEQR